MSANDADEDDVDHDNDGVELVDEMELLREGAGLRRELRRDDELSFEDSISTNSWCRCFASLCISDIVTEAMIPV